ncbi:hypothetical protein M5K25_017819 [Dendrobium thyrsiflorum]|uniref:Uncharacterized protein n=1 Tax=Dendrobium thyrsiflorum TaxID=117978 RepID=A0ABD0UNF9_DENTH
MIVPIASTTTNYEVTSANATAIVIESLTESSISLDSCFGSVHGFCYVHAFCNNIGEILINNEPQVQSLRVHLGRLLRAEIGYRE